jgi:peptidylprolyl isomerase
MSRSPRLLLVPLALALFLGAAACSSSSTTTASSATTAGGSEGGASATGSAAGKPCVAEAAGAPASAPAVPVQVGAPPTQLVVKDLKTGTGPKVTASDTVTVNYIGVSCSTGQVFDSSWSRGQTATFALDQVIPGWTQGLVGMQAGGRRLLGIPPSLGYGSQGQPPTIAPDETLWFVVDLVSIGDQSSGVTG